MLGSKKKRSIQGTPLKLILSGNNEFGFLNCSDPGLGGLAKSSMFGVGN
jgi:hypothetical protein